MIRKGSLLDLVGRITVMLVLLVISVLVAVGLGVVTDNVYAQWASAEAVLATPYTSGNCEIYATVEGEDRYACDDFARGYTCYDRVQGMTFCVEMTEEYK